MLPNTLYTVCIQTYVNIGGGEQREPGGRDWDWDCFWIKMHSYRVDNYIHGDFNPYLDIYIVLLHWMRTMKNIWSGICGVL